MSTARPLSLRTAAADGLGRRVALLTGTVLALCALACAMQIAVPMTFVLVVDLLEGAPRQGMYWPPLTSMIWPVT